MRRWIVWAALFAAVQVGSLARAHAAPAEGRRPEVNFQFGADAFGGIGDTRFIGGVNATLVYPVVRRVWVGIRPALHYLVPKDSDFDVAWLHPDLAVHVNLLHAPLRLYALAAGGYSLAVAPDLQGGPAHGWSLTAGVGAAWKWRGPLGLFAELAFRGGSASRRQNELKRDASGQPICDEECQVYETEEVSRDFRVLAFTVNVGLFFAPP